MARVCAKFAIGHDAAKDGLCLSRRRASHIFKLLGRWSCCCRRILVGVHGIMCVGEIISKDKAVYIVIDSARSKMST